MRRKIALSFIVILLLSVVSSQVVTVPAYASDNAKQIINAVGIMETDSGSNEVGTKAVTRARFAQMLVNASSLKGTVSNGSSVSLYSDVKKNYWAAGYIQTAVTQGWMTGYLNGKFKPSKGVSLQEAVYAVVKLLGYTSSDFSGNLVTGIMNLYQSKNLDVNISKTKTQYLTVDDCYHLFYNLLITTTKTGSVYAVSLGYKVDSNGEPDYLSLVSSGMKGPIIADVDWKNELPFSTAQATFYRDGVVCSQSDISDYDVLYYSVSLKTVWIYDNKITGTIEAINPDYTTPQSVTISGKTYSFADSTVSVKFSSMGDAKEGEMVTLILGKDNTVVDVVSIDEYNTTITGVVLGTGTHTVEVSGTYTSSNYVTFVDAAGNEYQQDYDKTLVTYAIGDLTRLTFTNGTEAVSKVTLGSTSFGNNTFSSDSSTLGNMKLASNVKILDLEGTNYISTYPDRLAGVTLPGSSVYYYELNANGELTQLILNNITGDMDKYGVYTGYTVQGTDKINYQYMIGSVVSSLSTSSLINLSNDEGPKGFVFTDDVLTKSYALTGVEVTSIGTNTLLIGNTKYTLAEGYNVYLSVNGEYIPITIEKISDLAKYSLRAYYDKDVSAGGRIRVIVAVSK
jgi:hypothetical protein